MAYEAYRPERGGADAGYFETNGPTYSTQYNTEPREKPPSRYQNSSTSRQTTSDNMTSAPDRAESSGTDVSPELIAAITERVKKERMFNINEALSLAIC